MRDIYSNQLIKLKEDILRMASDVVDAYSDVDSALFENKIESIKDMENIEKELNLVGNSLDNDCSKLCLFQRPLASDLRFVSASQRVILHLEKISHQLLEISDIIKNMSKENNLTLSTLQKMSEADKNMLICAIKSYETKDFILAKNVIKIDDEIDGYFLMMRNEVVDMIKTGQVSGEQALDIYMVSKYYERIGDHIESLAKEVTNI